MSTKTIRCAVYTRKSSEEGLDQSFNSIDAQREACEAYVLSQRHEGWKVLPARYDDGGFSGGTLTRPAIQRLLADIRAGLVDLVVVYKIDRLTRSLADFAKMVETFDAHSASFVSVTQHFNTTSSMGRLTLNVLLSFAQFEREVTGERIRDKIAASKKKGMWMGGLVPVGYDLVNRHLIVNDTEAKLVRSIYESYLKTGSVRLVQQQLGARQVVSKIRVTPSGKESGGKPFMKGAIYAILKNRIYLGEIGHKDVWYEGEHEAIVDRDLFDKVQAALAISLDRRNSGVHAKEPSLLAGWVQDTGGRPLTPSHALKKGKRYRYYISRPKEHGDPLESGQWAPKTSVPAHDLEKLIVQSVAHWLRSSSRLMNDLKLLERESDERTSIMRWAESYAEKIRQASPKEQRLLLTPVVRTIIVGTQEVKVFLQRRGTLTALGIKEAFDPEEDDMTEDAPMLSIDARLKRYGMEMRLVVNEEWAKIEELEVDSALVSTLATAYRWWTMLTTGEVKSIAEISKNERVGAGFVAKLLRGALLAPDIVQDMLDGRVTGTYAKDLARPRSHIWSEQRTQLRDAWKQETAN